MDWVKDGAIAVAGLAVAEKLLKVVRAWKYVDRPMPGVTVKNGEYKSLVKTLGRIEGRIDHVVERVEAIEQRLST